MTLIQVLLAIIDSTEQAEQNFETNSYELVHSNIKMISKTAKHGLDIIGHQLCESAESSNGY